MKVCGITVINTPTYGAILQAYALQEAVEQLGHSYMLMNYCNENQEKKFTFFGRTDDMSWKYNIYKKIQYPIMKYRLAKMLRFQNSYCHLTEKVNDANTLNHIASEFDAFICGSDQIWNNQEINHFDEAYFLAFATEAVTIAYAPSFGKTWNQLKEEDIEFYKKHIPAIKHLSVREDEGIDIVKKVSMRTAELVCDPVFLLNEQKWSEFAEEPREKNYILVYLIGNMINDEINQEIITFAKTIAKKEGKKVIKISRGLSSMIKEGAFRIPTVEQWIGLIKHADIVLTNSFHGMSFCLMFKKRFHVFVKGGTSSKMNTRIYSLLNRIGAESALINIDDIGQSNDSFLDYEVVEQNIIAFRESSIKYLKNALE